MALAFLLPALALLGAMVVYPIVFSAYRSMFDASGNTFVGAHNYTRIFTDADSRTAMRNTLIWVVVAPSLVTVLGLIFAVLTERIRWAAAFKMIVFMPMAVSFLASGVIFRLVYDGDPNKGVINAVLTTVHDTFSSSSVYPGAIARPGSPLNQAPGNAFVTATGIQPGQAVLLPLVGLPAAQLPKNATQAIPAPAPPPDGISGTVWLDFTRGGGGVQNHIDPAEKGLPGMRVQAVQAGKAVASTTTRPDGTFAFTKLPAGTYTLKLPGSNFAAPYQGVTWLGPSLITPAIIGAYIWIWAGFAMVLIAAGLAAIPRDVLEAARMDGASEWHLFRKITVPLLAPVLTVVFVTLVINVLKVFDLVFIIAPGSVQPQATVLALEMWRVSFGGGADQGAGSAMAIFLCLLVLPAMIFNLRRFRQEQR